MSGKQNVDTTPEEVRELYKAKQSRNRAVLLAIFGVCALFFVITIVRMG